MGRSTSLKIHPVLGILPPLTQAEIDRAVEHVSLYGQTRGIEALDGANINRIR